MLRLLTNQKRSGKFMRSHSHRLLAVTSILATATVLAQPACAESAPAATLDAASASQTQSPAGNGNASAGDGIVVTARRSSEKVQDVPLAMSVQTASSLAAHGITGLESLARFTPSLQYKDFVTSFHGNATIRGLSQVNTANAVGNVGVFLNGVYLQRGYMVDTSLGDYARIETVNGPQSALYGQNAFAGAINYVTVAPSNQLHVDAAVDYGNAGNRKVQIGVGAPIIKDVLSVRLFGAVSDYSGTWKNQLTGITGDAAHFGGSHKRAGSIALHFTPTEKLTVDASYQENKRSEGIRAYYTLSGTSKEDALNCGPTVTATGRPSLFCGAFPVNPAAYRSGTGTLQTNPYSVEQPTTDTDTKVMRVSADYVFSPALSLHYLFGRAIGTANEDLSIANNTYNPTGATTYSAQHEGGVLHYASHEARLNYTPADSVLKLEGGYFHSNSDDRYLFGVRSVTAGTTLTHASSDPLVIPTGLIVYSNSDSKTTIDSLFGRAGLDLLDKKLQLAAELRWSDTSLNYNDLNARATDPTLPLLKSSYKDWTPRFTIDYHPTRGLLAYASAARGVKAGGFNGYKSSTYTLTTAEQSFGEEKNWTYEIGTKGTFLGGKLIVNADLFYVDWANKQSAVTPSAYNTAVSTPTFGTAAPTIYQASGNATSKGFELAGSYRPIAPLTFNYAFSYIDPKYSKNAIAANFIGLCTTQCPVNGSIAGKQIERTSKVSGSAGFDYTHALKGEWTSFIGGDVTYQSKQYADQENLSYINAFALVNARLGVDNGSWKVWLWTRNMFDHKYVSSVFYTVSTRNFTASYGEGRTFGASAAFKY
jgi:iron complex outermembrane receptor protein